MHFIIRSSSTPYFTSRIVGVCVSCHCFDKPVNTGFCSLYLCQVVPEHLLVCYQPTLTAAVLYFRDYYLYIQNNRSSQALGTSLCEAQHRNLAAIFWPQSETQSCKLLTLWEADLVDLAVFSTWSWACCKASFISWGVGLEDSPLHRGCGGRTASFSFSSITICMAVCCAECR